MKKYYELDVSLARIEPRIWRRFLLRADLSFADLHRVIQEGFGWENKHLWEFLRLNVRGESVAGPSNKGGDGRPSPDASKVTFESYFGGDAGKRECDYIYDFGDDWMHKITFVRSHASAEDFERQLLAGERAAPPEDCGGPPGYARMVQFAETGEDVYGEDPEELRDWLGEWRPEGFDLEKVKAGFDRWGDAAQGRCTHRRPPLNTFSELNTFIGRDV